MDEPDLALSALLASPPLEPDPEFAARIAALVEAEARWSAARKAAWRRFAGEAISAAGIAVGAVAVARLAGEPGMMPSGPGLAAALALLCWLLTRAETRATA
jgi:hypothetical protein